MPQLGLAISAADAQASPLLRAALAELSPSLLQLTLSLPDQAVQWSGIAQLAPRPLIRALSGRAASARRRKE